MKLLHLVTEAISKQNIIKTLKAPDFNIENLLAEFETAYNATFESYGLNNGKPVPYVGAYVMKIFSLLKKKENRSQRDEEDFLLMMPVIMAFISFIVNKKILSSLPSEFQTLINELPSIKNFDGLMEWSNKFFENLPTLKGILQDIFVKHYYKPIVTGDGFKIYKFTNYAEARAIGADTHWCVSSSNGANIIRDYLQDNDLYALVLEESTVKEKFLLTIPKPYHLKLDSDSKINNIIEKNIENVFKKASFKSLEIGTLNEDKKILQQMTEDMFKRPFKGYFSDMMVYQHDPILVFKDSLNDKMYKSNIINRLFSKQGYKELNSIILESLKNMMQNIAGSLYIDNVDSLDEVDDLTESKLLDVFQNIVLKARPAFRNSYGTDSITDTLTLIVYSKTTTNLIYNILKNDIKENIDDIEYSYSAFFEFADIIDDHKVSFAEYIKYYEKIPGISKRILEEFARQQEEQGFPTKIDLGNFMTVYLNNVNIYEKFVSRFREYLSKTRETREVYDNIKKNKEEFIYYVRQFIKGVLFDYFELMNLDNVDEFMKAGALVIDKAIYEGDALINRIIEKGSHYSYDFLLRKLNSTLNRTEELDPNIYDEFENYPYTCIADLIILKILDEYKRSDELYIDYTNNQRKSKFVEELYDKLTNSFNNKKEKIINNIHNRPVPKL